MNKAKQVVLDIGNRARTAALVLATSAPVLALADPVDAATEIGNQKTLALAVAGAFLGMGIAVWGGMYLYRKFFK